MNLIQSFKKTVSQHRLFNPDDRLLIAVSGGADSTALCHLCKELGYDFGIAHVNYCLRGSDADADAAFVESMARDLEVPYFAMAIDCDLYATTNHLSLQEAARQVRYDFFDGIVEMYDYQYVLTAHHAADNSETMLYTFVKGATVNALRGIPIQRGYISRPLLYSKKSEIASYIRRNDLSYRKDLSNQSVKYKRNFIRHEVIPLIQEINPSVESTLINTSKLGASYQILIGMIISNAREEFLKSNIINLLTCEISNARLAWLYELIHHLGYNVNDVEAIWTAYDSGMGTGKIFIHGNHRLILDRDLLVLEHTTEMDKPEPIRIHSLDSANIDARARLYFEVIDQVGPNKTSAIFDLSKIEFPLTLRSWLPGDRFRPKGMKGQSKKVKDFLTDLKITGMKRSEVQVLISKEEIIWIVGHRMAEGYTAAGGDATLLQIKPIQS